MDAKKDDGKSNSKNSNSVNDKKEEDGTVKSGTPSDKKESAMSLGEIARIESYIKNSKVDSLQVLHSVSGLYNFRRKVSIKSIIFYRFVLLVAQSQI